jgi:TP901 family phage tail tape measure protein
MAINETGKSTVYIDGKQAETELQRLSSEVDNYVNKMNMAKKANDKAGFDKAKADLQAARKEMASYKQSVVDVTRVLNNLNGTSYNQLLLVQRKLQREIKDMNKTTKEEIALYNQKVAQLQKVTAQTAKVREEMNGASTAQRSWMGKMADGFNRYMGMFAAISASLIGIVFTFRKAVDAANEFESSIANLSALTGLAGKELDWLEKKALELSGSITENGIRITQTAQEIVDAFTKVGSARPELLQNKEALAEVTRQAIILASASKSELQPSIEALTMVLNQYNVSADESERIINALAAGSKAGAGEIPYLTTAFEKAGTVAADANISIETLTAAIETLAPRITQPEIAGRSLKGVLIDLQTTSDETNPAIVGLATALENLSKKQLSTTQLVKLFGTENITTAKILINNVEELRKYEDAVTGTNTAVEQAIINTSTNKAKLEAARAELQKVTIELGERLAPALTFSTSSFSHLIRATVSAIKFFNEYKGVIISVIAGLTAYTIAVNAQTIAFKAHYYWLVLNEKAVKLFNTTLKSNPIGLIVGLLTSAAAALFFYSRKTEEATENQEEFNNELARTGELLGEDIYKNLESSGRDFFEWAKTAQVKDLEAVKQYLQKRQGELNRELTNLPKNVTDAQKKYWIDAINNVRENILAIDKELAKAELVPSMTPEEYAAANADEFKKWKQAREEYLEAQSIYELNLQTSKEFLDRIDKAAEERAKAKAEAEKKWDAAMQEDFIMPDEEDIQDDPQLTYALNLAQAELAVWQESYEGRKAALDEMLAAGYITEKQYQEELYNLNQEYLNTKLNKYYQYLAASSEMLAGWETFQQAQMNKELKAAEGNEVKQEEIRKKYAEREKFTASAQAQIRGAMAIMSLWGNNVMPYPAAAVFNGIMTGVIAATTMAQVALINSRQFATGNYLDVIGASDGKKYRSRVVSQNHPSALYNEPTFVPGFGLFGETSQPEMVFNPSDTQKIINTPELIDAINYTLKGIPVPGSATSTSSITNNYHSSDTSIAPLLERIDQKLGEPSIAIIDPDYNYLTAHNRAMEKLDKLKKKSSG